VSRARCFLALLVLVLARVPAVAQNNTTAALAANVQWGQRIVSFENGTNSEFWFRVMVVAGRSYCVETGNAEVPYGDRFFGTGLIVYRGNQATMIVSGGGDILQEPNASQLARVCWIPTFSEQNFVQLLSIPPPGAVTPVSSNVTVRFVETTLFCPWFFIAGDYNSFTLIRNTTSTVAQGVVVNWRDTLGGIVGTTTVNINPNGTLILNARDFVNSATTSNGSVEIAHRGALDSLKGSTTTISGSTGLSFDALFERRTPW